MTREIFNVYWAALLNAFPSDRITDHSQDVYWQMLQEIPDNLWEHGARRCLAECKFFPSISELGDFCLGEDYEYNPRTGGRKLIWTEALAIWKNRDLKKRGIHGPIRSLGPPRREIEHNT